jgi:hypothetical protein
MVIEVDQSFEIRNGSKIHYAEKGVAAGPMH